MKYTIKKDSKNIHKCSEPCPFLNDGKSEAYSILNGVKIGSGFCQKECKHHKNNNMIEKYGKDYNVSLGGVIWIECDKLDKYFLD
jgi:hypothetical protein